MAVLTTAVAALGGKAAIKGAVKGAIKEGVVKGLGGLFKSALGSNFKGFFKNGLAFSCLGNQAFNNQDYSNLMKSIQQSQTDAVNAGTEEAFIAFLEYVNAEAVFSDLEIGRYRSKCSKQLRGEAKKAMDQILESAKSFGYRITGTKKIRWANDEITINTWGLDENSEAYRTEAVKHLPAVTAPVERESNLFEGLDTEVGDGLTNYMVAPETVTPTRSGNIRVDVEGDGFEGNVRTGRFANENNTLLYLLVGFGIMYFLTKKR